MKYTQKQLEEMSDGELNIEVALIQAKDYEPNVKSAEYDERLNCIWIESTGFQSFRVENYCNRWEKIGSLILSYGISLVYMLQDGWEAHALLGDDGVGYDEKHNTTHDNPLRAAAIVYILIKQGE